MQSKQAKLNFLLAGVGGQGTILASDVLVNVGLAAGYQAKKAEVHGMSQRGGSVISHVRWGDVVYSPLAGAGEIDVFLAFEKAEALRNLNQLRTNALALINMEAIIPISVISTHTPYPEDAGIVSTFQQITSHAAFLNATGIAKKLGNIKVGNIVLLGALSMLMEQQALTTLELTVDVWLDAISQRAPQQYVELNRAAFLTGRESIIVHA